MKDKKERSELEKFQEKISVYLLTHLNYNLANYLCSDTNYV